MSFLTFSAKTKSHSLYLNITWKIPIKFFLNNTNTRFLAFLYKTDYRALKFQQKIKLPPVEIELVILSILTKIPEMSYLCHLGKTRIVD